uniref:SAM domain-containing protein n=1 Tax=Anopheles albimanus TaxID=7167 RepID=A0A182F212_ANOAL
MLPLEPIVVIRRARPRKGTLHPHQDTHQDGQNHQQTRQKAFTDYKFGTVNRRKKHAAQVASALPHMETAGWLQRLDLPEYRDNFKSYGGVEEMLFLTESDVKKLGIRNNAHRARIVSSLVALRENLVQGGSGSSHSPNRMGVH